MESLVGKAQDDDDTFWSHSIWAETGGGFSDGAGRKRRRSSDNDNSDGSEASSASSGDEGGSDDDDGSSSQSDGEGSYRMSEDDASAAVDQFDSDFDESESDEDGGDDEGGEGEEERELRAEERREKANKRKKNQRSLGITTHTTMQPLKKATSAGRELMRKKTGGGRVGKRGPLGTGWNEGLVLNWPPPPSSSLGTAVAVATTVGVGVKKPVMVTAQQQQPLHHAQNKSATVQSTEPSTSTIPDATSQPLPQHIASKPAAPIDVKAPAKPSLKTGTIPTPVATATTTVSVPAPLPKVKPPPPSPKRSRQRQKSTTTTKKSTKIRHQITQEQMIIESIQSTETTNSKWINARKRTKEEAIQKEKAHAAAKNRANAIKTQVSRFYSRRGRHNILTFMDMDHLPDILTRRHASSSTVVAVSSRRDGGMAQQQRQQDRSPAAATTKRRRMDNTTSENSESPLPTTVLSATATTTTASAASAEETNQHEKCVITGKIAKYRDPKTMLGYHDIDAYKEIKRRLEVGELKVAAVVRSDNRRRSGSGKGSGSNNNNAATIHKSHFPFGSDKPTMVATMMMTGAMTKKKLTVKVMVTLGGCPVSPPTTKKPSKSTATKESSVTGDRKKPPELQLPANTNLNGKKPVAGSDIGKANKDASASITDTSKNQQQSDTKVEPQPLSAPSGTSTVVGGTKNGSSSLSKAAAAPPKVLSNELQTAFFEKPTAPAPVKKRGRGRPPKQKPAEKPAVALVNPIQQLQQPHVVSGIGIIGAVKPEAVPAPAVPAKRKRGRPPKAKPAAPAVPQQPQVAAGTQQQTQTTVGGPAPAKRKRGRPPKVKPAVPTPVPQQPQMVAGMPAALMNQIQMQQPQMVAGMPAALINPLQLQQSQFAAGMPAALAALTNPMQQPQMAVRMPYALVNPIQQHQMTAMTNLLMNPTVPVNPIQQSQIPAPKVNDQVGNGKKVGVQPKVLSKAVAVHQPLGTTGKQGPVADNNNAISKSATAVTKTSPKSIHQMKDEQP